MGVILPDEVASNYRATTLGEIFDIKDSRVVVTGAASGLGRSVAIGFAELGARIIALDVNAPGLEALQSEVREARGVLTTVTCDLSSESSVGDAFRVIGDGGQTIDALVHLAGIAGPLESVADLSMEQWDHVLQTNLTSAFLLAKSAIPLFSPDGIGKIVLTSSTWGVVGSRRVPVSAYAASKAGILGLAAQLAMELAPTINVNTIVPAGIRSRIADGFYDDPKAVEALVRDLPVGQIRDADAVLGLCLVLTTSASDHITGAVMNVDGGYLGY